MKVGYLCGAVVYTGFEEIKPSLRLKAKRIPIDERRLKMNN
jgi:hypothetical protein